MPTVREKEIQIQSVVTRRMFRRGCVGAPDRFWISLNQAGEQSAHRRARKTGG